MKKKEFFTKRQLQVLRKISKGIQRKTIADLLKIYIKTVDGHIGKLHAKSKTHLWGELVAFGIKYFAKLKEAKAKGKREKEDFERLKKSNSKNKKNRKALRLE